MYYARMTRNPYWFVFACQHEFVQSDMAAIGKALGGGFYPVSVVLADRL